MGETSQPDHSAEAPLSYSQTIDALFAPIQSWDNKEKRYAEALKHGILQVGQAFDNQVSDPFVQAILAEVKTALSDQQTFHQEMVDADLNHYGFLEEGLRGTRLFRKQLVTGNMIYNMVADAYRTIKETPAGQNYAKDPRTRSIAAGWGQGSLQWSAPKSIERYGKKGGHRQLVFTEDDDHSFKRFRVGRSLRQFSPQD